MDPRHCQADVLRRDLAGHRVRCGNRLRCAGSQPLTEESARADTAAIYSPNNSTIFVTDRAHRVIISDMSDALFLCRNARSFLASARLPMLSSDGRIYYLAISMELSLKAYLRLAGWSDEDTRVLVRHDLTKASELAAALGLNIPEADCVAVISSRYANGGFRHPPSINWGRSFVRAATSHALTLNNHVARCLV